MYNWNRRQRGDPYRILDTVPGLDSVIVDPVAAYWNLIAGILSSTSWLSGNKGNKHVDSLI